MQPKRKNIRLKEYDYSQEGYYFITICTKNRKKILSKIEYNKQRNVGVDVHIDPQIKLTQKGKIIKDYIEKCNKKIENVYIDQYIIMPNHIHIIIVIEKRVDVDIDPYNF